MTPVPDFPSELVEAVRTVSLKGRQLDRISPVEAEAILAAVVPLIEQRVIDRLAREAGENPYSRRGAWSPISFVAWRDGAACGVAAERARCPLCDHEWRRHDPEDGRCDCHSETIIGPCQCGRDLAWMQERIAAMSAAALSSPAEPDTGEDA